MGVKYIGEECTMANLSEEGRHEKSFTEPIHSGYGLLT